MRLDGISFLQLDRALDRVGAAGLGAVRPLGVARTDALDEHEGLAAGHPGLVVHVQLVELDGGDHLGDLAVLELLRDVALGAGGEDDRAVGRAPVFAALAGRTVVAKLPTCPDTAVTGSCSTPRY